MSKKIFVGGLSCDTDNVLGYEWNVTKEISIPEGGGPATIITTTTFSAEDVPEAGAGPLQRSAAFLFDEPLTSYRVETTVVQIQGDKSADGLVIATSSSGEVVDAYLSEEDGISPGAGLDPTGVYTINESAIEPFSTVDTLDHDLFK